MKCGCCGNTERVHKDGDTWRCESCGAIKFFDKWTRKCQKCHKEVDHLVGLFVPHLCQNCLDEIVEIDRKSGNICGMCRQPRSLCCC